MKKLNQEKDYDDSHCSIKHFIRALEILYADDPELKGRSFSIILTGPDGTKYDRNGKINKGRKVIADN